MATASRFLPTEANAFLRPIFRPKSITSKSIFGHPRFKNQKECEGRRVNRKLCLKVNALDIFNFSSFEDDDASNVVSSEEVLDEEDFVFDFEDPSLSPLDENFFRMGHLRSVRAFGIEFKEGPQGVGVYSTMDIAFMKLPRIVMEIPVELMISVSQDHPWIFRPDIVPEGHPLFDIIEATQPETEWDLRVACLILLASKQESNFWNLYSDYLPPKEEIPSLLLATTEELSELQNNDMASKIENEQKRLNEFYATHWKTGKVPRAVAELCDSDEKFRWAVSLARSRAVSFFCIFGALRKDVHLIAPYVDMLNHADPGTCFLRWQKVEQRVQVVLKPGQVIKKGQQLTLTYSENATNDELMEKYCFSLKGNPWEKMDFSQVDSKIHLDTFLSTFQIFGPHEDYRFYDESLLLKNPASGWMLAASRNLPSWQNLFVPSLPTEELVDSKAIQKECERQLQNFPTTLETDSILLENGHDKSETWKAALRYRMNKKEYLETIITALDIYCDSFE